MEMEKRRFKEKIGVCVSVCERERERERLRERMFKEDYLNN